MSDWCSSPRRSCNYVLSNGQRFVCSRELFGREVYRALLAHCRRLPAIEISTAQWSTIHALEDARACLRKQGLDAIGSAVLPGSSRSPDGDVVVKSIHPTFIDFYISAAKARRLETDVRPSPHPALVERRASVTIGWSATPSPTLRHAVESCTFQ